MSFLRRTPTQNQQSPTTVTAADTPTVRADSFEAGAANNGFNVLSTDERAYSSPGLRKLLALQSATTASIPGAAMTTPGSRPASAGAPEETASAATPAAVSATRSRSGSKNNTPAKKRGGSASQTRAATAVTQPGRDDEANNNDDDDNAKSTDNKQIAPACPADILSSHLTLLQPADVALLEAAAASGEVPPGTSWLALRNDVLRPALEHLLKIAVEYRSDRFLPNGLWSGPGSRPSGPAANATDAAGGITPPPRRANSATKTASTTNDNAKGNHNSDSDGTEEGEDASLEANIAAVVPGADMIEENRFLLEHLQHLHSVPFTLQRLCEIILNHHRFHCFDYERSSNSSKGAGAASGSRGHSSSSAPAAAATTATSGGSTTAVIAAALVATSPAAADAAAASDDATFSPLVPHIVGGVARATAMAEAPQPVTPRRRGVLRGEKLQAAIRRCILVSPL